MNISGNVNSIQTNINTINKSAEEIANKKDINLVKEFQEQTMANNAVMANVSVIETNDELFETLLDIIV